MNLVGKRTALPEAEAPNVPITLSGRLSIMMSTMTDAAKTAGGAKTPKATDGSTTTIVVASSGAR